MHSVSQLGFKSKSVRKIQCHLKFFQRSMKPLFEMPVKIIFSAVTLKKVLRGMWARKQLRCKDQECNPKLEFPE